MSQAGRFGWALLAAWSLVSACAGGPGRPDAQITPELVGANNRAAGLMGQFDFSAAAEAFDALRRSHPAWPGARLNYAIALMNRQQSGDAVQAEQELRALLDEPTVSRRARYTLALLLAHEGRDAESLPLLEQVESGNPPDGFAAYFAGQQRLTSSPTEALSSFRTAIAREPLLRSAYYGSFLALRRLDREAEAGEMLARFQALEPHPQALVAEFKYTRMGPLAEVVLADVAGVHAPSAPGGERFQAAVPLVDESSLAWTAGSSPHSITVADIDGDGVSDVFIAGALAGRAPNAVLLRRGDRFVADAQHPLAAVSGVHAALWGDLDDDGLVDVVLCRPAGGTLVWRQATAGRWADVTPSIGARMPQGNVVDGAVFDADHDGDLDVILINRSGPNELLNNDGDMRFRAIGVQAGIAGDGRPSLGLALADLDGDRDTDVVVVKASPPHDVLLNNRAWVYERDTRATALAAATMSSLLAGDVDADGQPELYSTGESGLAQWRKAPDGTWSPTTVVAQPAVGGPLAWADIDGDGAFELIASSQDGWAAYVPDVSGSSWSVVPGATGTSQGGWAIAHLDAARGPSVLGLDAQARPLVWQPGVGRLRFVSLTFSGRDPTSDQRRSNVSGIGTRVAVRTGSNWTAFETTRLASGPGQSAQPVSVGLGSAERADFVSLIWSDGVLQTEVGLEAGRLHALRETQRQLSSCPVLFAWDGERYTFVTDVLGVGGIGFLERPGVYSEPFPRENVMLPDWLTAAPDGTYKLRVAEPMEEVAYLDSLSLVAYDLPPGWKMTLDERKAVTGDAPTGAPIFYRDEQLPARAVTGTGEDVTERLREIDLTAAGPDALVPRFIGMAEPWSVTLTFDEPIDRGRGRPVLVADGWVEYPYAQTVFAAWQADARYDAPTLEARGEDGQWRVVADSFGYPAGMPRQMAFPLPPLPPGTTALRLRTSQEIYWDRLAIVYAEPLPAARRSVLTLRAASLEAVGFARRTTGPQRTPHYDETARAPLGDTRHPRGWYTEFGPIDPLVQEEDGAVAVVGPGEAVTVAFDAPGAPLATGWTRRLVLETRGWCKDMDLYTRDGDTIEPLPGEHSEARARLHARFNTRYAGGF